MNASKKRSNIIFLIVHFMFEKMFKLPKDARFRKR